MPEPERKPQIAILGGGIGGLATAWHLTNDPAVRKQYDITIYQLGWRLGGKCASSRNEQARGRIEEHGIHGFLGCYYNALEMMWDCYRELGLDFEASFLPVDYMQMWAFRNRKWKLWSVALPRNKRVPWRESRDPEHFDAYPTVRDWLGAMIDVLIGKTWFPFRWLPWLILRPARYELTKARGPRPYLRLLDIVTHGLEALLEWPAKSSDWTRRLFVELDYIRAFVRGLLADGVLDNGFDSIDEDNFSKWLGKHGAKETTLSSPLTVNNPNVLFAYRNGDTTRPPEMGAGAYAHWTLRSFSYLGSFAYKFGAGTGEVVIAPLYEALKRRGVKFEFFHKVKELRLTKGRIDEVVFDVQATTLSGGQYSPLSPNPGSDGRRYWPDAPDYDQLRHGKLLRGKGVNLESHWADWSLASDYVGAMRDDAAARLETDSQPGKLPEKPLAIDEGDHVVLAISIGALSEICPQLIEANPRWQDMLDHLKPVQTQSMQIWLTQCAKHLGWNAGRKGKHLMLGATYLNPMSCQADFSPLIKCEDWAKNESPQTLIYFCGPLAHYGDLPPPDDHDFPARQKLRVEWLGIQYLQSATGPLLPKATGEARAKIDADKAKALSGVAGPIPAADPIGLDFDLLACHDRRSADVGGARFRQQFVRANIDPSELYVTSPPGSTEYRLKAWESGFANLTLAGDWIYTGLNCGSVEGATMGGMLAAHHINGSPGLSHIIGYEPHKSR